MESLFLRGFLPSQKFGKVVFKIFLERDFIKKNHTRSSISKINFFLGRSYMVFVPLFLEDYTNKI